MADIHNSRCESVTNIFACKKWWKEINLFYSILFYVVGPGDGEDSRGQKGRQDWGGGGQAGRSDQGGHGRGGEDGLQVYCTVFY
jgi:hypothetical protein